MITPQPSINRMPADDEMNLGICIIFVGVVWGALIGGLIAEDNAGRIAIFTTCVFASLAALAARAIARARTARTGSQRRPVHTGRRPRQHRAAFHANT